MTTVGRLKKSGPTGAHVLWRSVAGQPTGALLNCSALPRCPVVASLRADQSNGAGQRL